MKVEIKGEYMQLQQLLKITDWINSGGEAKIAVRTLKIKVNGIPENRRGRKLYPGDVVEIEKRRYELG